MISTDKRAQFDIPESVAYFNAPQIGPLPKCAVEAGAQSYRDKSQPWANETQHTFFDQPERLRALGAALFETAPDNIALVPAASYGLAVAARNIALEPGDEILVLEGQFPSNVYTWQALADRTGARLRRLQRAPEQSWAACLIAAMGSKTALVACAHVHWIDGGQIDLEAVAEAARNNGAALVLDLTQSLGMMDIDLKTVDPDFAVAAAYKWLLSPYTSGFLYVAPRNQNGEPLEENWISRSGSEDFSRLIDYQDTYQDGARRFDMGERSSFQIVPGAIAALEFFLGAGKTDIRSHARAINADIAERLGALGFRDETPQRAAHYLSLTAPEQAPDDLAMRLRALDVHVSQRGPRLRIGAHIYNTTKDVDLLVDAVKGQLL